MSAATPKTIVFLREPSADDLALAESLNLRLAGCPLQVPTFFPPEDLATTLRDSKAEAVVFTSQHAVEALALAIEQFGPLPLPQMVFAIGPATGEALEDLGITPMLPDDATAVSMVDLLRRYRMRSVLHLAGARRRPEMALGLKAVGVELAEAVVYQMERLPFQLPGRFDAVAFFAPSNVEQLFSLPEANPVFEKPCLAIGKTTQATLRDFGIPTILVSKEPTSAGLIRLAADYFAQSDRYRA